MDALKEVLDDAQRRLVVTSAVGGLLVTDREGVIICASAAGMATAATANAAPTNVTTSLPDDATSRLHALAPAVAAAFASCSDQLSRIGLGRNRVIVAQYHGRQLVQTAIGVTIISGSGTAASGSATDHSPFILTLIAGSEANTGVLMDACEELGGELGELLTGLA